MTFSNHKASSTPSGRVTAFILRAAAHVSTATNNNGNVLTQIVTPPGIAATT